MFWPKRSEELEIIDKGPSYFTLEEYYDCLGKLDKVGEHLGGDKASLDALKQLNFIPASILDVGCGGGGFTKKLGRLFPKSTVEGIDISMMAVDYAKAHNQSSNVRFKKSYLEDIPSKSYDIIISTLVCHHLNESELISFIKECLRVAKKKVIFNDLHRNIIPWFTFKLIAPLMFRNRLITLDGCISVKRAFTRKDWERYFKEIKVNAQIEWHFPFRWIVILTPSGDV